jgi:hypothetical protein
MKFDKPSKMGWDTSLPHTQSIDNMKQWFVFLVALGLLVTSAHLVDAAPRLLKINSHATDYNNQKHVTGMYRRTRSTTDDLILRTGRPFVVSLTFSEPLASRANLVPLFRMRQASNPSQDIITWYVHEKRLYASGIQWYVKDCITLTPYLCPCLLALCV